MYEWDTVNGRFKAARDIAKLERLGEEKEAEMLRDTLKEAIALYDTPEYYILTDKAHRQFLFLYGHRDGWDENGFHKFLTKHIDNYVCHVVHGSTWIQGLICQQCEPVTTRENFEKWHVFETEDGNLWFEKM